MSAPSQGTKMSRMIQPALAQPPRDLSRNRSKRQRNHTISAAIQMKNQKLHSRTCPKLVVIESIVVPFVADQAGSAPGWGQGSQRMSTSEARSTRRVRGKVWPLQQRRRAHRQASRVASAWQG